MAGCADESLPCSARISANEPVLLYTGTIFLTWACFFFEFFLKISDCTSGNRPIGSPAIASPPPQTSTPVAVPLFTPRSSSPDADGAVVAPLPFPGDAADGDTDGVGVSAFEARSASFTIQQEEANGTGTGSMPEVEIEDSDSFIKSLHRLSTGGVTAAGLPSTQDAVISAQLVVGSSESQSPTERGARLTADNLATHTDQLSQMSPDSPSGPAGIARSRLLERRLNSTPGTMSRAGSQTSLASTVKSMRRTVTSTRAGSPIKKRTITAL